MKQFILPNNESFVHVLSKSSQFTKVAEVGEMVKSIVSEVVCGVLLGCV